MHDFYTLFFSYACSLDITKILSTLDVNSLPTITITQRNDSKKSYYLLYSFYFLFFFTLEPGSQLSEELWHPARTGMQCHFHVGLRLKYTWSSPRPGVSSLKLEDLHLSVAEVQSYLLLTGFLLYSPINQEIRFKSAIISSLDHRDVCFTSSRESRSGLTALEVAIINSVKSHTPGEMALSGQISKH